MENPRTTSARDHDDSDLIDAMEDAPGTVGRSGGKLAQDVGTADELARATDPDAHTRATKEDDIDNNVARRSGNTAAS
jgi:hypothetical protein